jgi:hypothetical protein
VVFDGVDVMRVVTHFQRYLRRADLDLSGAEAERRMFEMLRNPRFLADMRPLSPPAAAAALTEQAATRAFCDVFTRFVIYLPGEPWARTPDMCEGFGLDLSNA